MPQLSSDIDAAPAVVPVTRAKTKSDVNDAIMSLKKHGFAIVDTSLMPSWTLVETLMNRLDKEMIELVNKDYNEKKIIKSSQSEDKDIDKKVAFDLSNDRLTHLAQNGLLNKFPELPVMTDYFTSSSQWLVNVAKELVEDQQTLGSLDFNFRMIDYSRGYGSCLTHRDFGLLTLIHQNGVSGLEVEMDGRMTPVPGDCSILLAGWCLHLISNGQIPAPLHQVTAPEARRLSCVTFMAPPKDLVLRPLNQAGPRVYRDVTVGDLKMMMAKRWRHREGTLLLENGDQDTRQSGFQSYQNLS